MTTNKNFFNLSTLRLSLSGALLGIAVMGLLANGQYHEEIGAILGGAAVLFAKARHFI